MSTYITVKQLAEHLHYNPRYINHTLKDKVFFEEELMRYTKDSASVIPMSNGGVCYG